MQRSSKKLLQGEIDPAYAARARFIFQNVESEKPTRILEVGCGRGFYVNALSKYTFVNEVWGIDVNLSYLTLARKNGDDKTNFIKASVYKLPFKDNCFDLIVCSEVLEHLTEEKKGLEEMRRVLKKNGALLITVPSKSFPFTWDPVNWILMKLFNTHINKDIWFLAGIWADHIRLYGENDIKRIVTISGFNIKSFSGVISFSWPFAHFILYGIGKNIVERMPSSQLNRFHENKGAFSIWLSRFFAFPSKIVVNKKTAVNLLVKAYKS